MPKEQLVKREADIIPIHKENGKGIEQNLTELNKQINDNDEEIEILEDAIREISPMGHLIGEYETRELKEMQDAINLLKKEQRHLLSKRDSLEAQVLSPQELREVDEARKTLGKSESPAAFGRQFASDFQEALKKEKQSKAE